MPLTTLRHNCSEKFCTELFATLHASWRETLRVFAQ